MINARDFNESSSGYGSMKCHVCTDKSYENDVSGGDF